MVNVRDLMKPAQEVSTLSPDATIEQALALTLGDIGAVVVLHGMDRIPVGLVTKTDLLQAYIDKVPLHHKVQEIMSRTIETIPESATKDAAAEHFQKTHHHHVFVVNDKEHQHWTGLLTIWDVALGTARQDRTWPWTQGAIDYFVAHSSPHIRRKILQPNPPKTTTTTKFALPDVEPHSFLGIAGLSDEFSAPVSPASIKKECVKTKPVIQTKPKKEPHTFLDIAGSSD